MLWLKSSEAEIMRAQYLREEHLHDEIDRKIQKIFMDLGISIDDKQDTARDLSFLRCIRKRFDSALTITWKLLVSSLFVGLLTILGMGIKGYIQ